MAKIGVLRTMEGGRVGFYCPGCKEEHQVTVEGPYCWGWNGSQEKPTFTPSILVRGVKDVDDEEIDRIYDSYKVPEDREKALADIRINFVCHSFVTDGKIQFLSDCTHELAGQAVDLASV